MWHDNLNICATIYNIIDGNKQAKCSETPLEIIWNEIKLVNIIWSDFFFHWGYFISFWQFYYFIIISKKHQLIHLNETKLTQKSEEQLLFNGLIVSPSNHHNLRLNRSCVVIWAEGIQKKTHKLCLRSDSPSHYLSHSWKSNTASHPSRKLLAVASVGPRREWCPL